MPRRVRHDGRVVVFPDGTSDDEVIAFLGQQGDTSEEEAVLDAFSPRPASRAPEPAPAPASRPEPPPPPVPSVARPSQEIADQAPDDAPSSFRPVLGDARSRVELSSPPLVSTPPPDPLSPFQRTARRRLTALDPFGPLPETEAGSGMPVGLRSGAMRPMPGYRREAPVGVLPAIGNQAQAGIMGLIGNLAQAPQGLERAVISPLMDALAGDQDTDHGMPASGLLGPRRPQMLGDVGPPQELPETWGPPNTVIPGDLGLRFGRDAKGELNWRGGPPDKDTASLAALTQEAQANLAEDTQIGRQLARARQQHPLETYSDPGMLAGIAAQGVPSLAAAYLSNRFGGAAGGVGMTAALEGGGATEDVLKYEKETGERVGDATASEAILKTAIGNALMEQLGPEAAMSKLSAGARIPLSALAEAIPEGLQEANQAMARELYAPPDPDANRQVLESTLGGLLLGGAAAAMPGHERPSPPPRPRGSVESVEPAPQPMLPAPPGPPPGEPSPLARGPFLLSPEQKERVVPQPPPTPVPPSRVEVQEPARPPVDVLGQALRDVLGGTELERVLRQDQPARPSVVNVVPSDAPPRALQAPRQDVPALPPRRPLELPAPQQSQPENRDPFAFKREVPEDLLPRPARRPLPLPEPEPSRIPGQLTTEPELYHPLHALEGLAEPLAAMPKTLDEIRRARTENNLEIQSVAAQIRHFTMGLPNGLADLSPAEREKRDALVRRFGLLGDRQDKLDELSLRGQPPSAPVSAPEPQKPGVTENQGITPAPPSFGQEDDGDRETHVPGNNAPPNNPQVDAEAKPQVEAPPAAPPKGKETPWDGRRLPENSLGKNPAGTWSFNGRVRGDLLYTRQDGSPPTPEDLKNAAQAGPRLAGLKPRVFQTEQEALDALNGTEPKKPTEVTNDQPGGDPVLEKRVPGDLPEPPGPGEAPGGSEESRGAIDGPVQPPAGPGTRPDRSGAAGGPAGPGGLRTAPDGGAGGGPGPAVRGGALGGGAGEDAGVEGGGPAKGPKPSPKPEAAAVQPEPVRAEPAPERVPETPRASNYVIRDPEKLFEGGPKGRARRNIDAIRTLREIVKQQRAATPEEQEKLAGYIGWGGIPKVFEHGASWDERHEFHKEASALYELLDADELSSARGSTVNAHYTDPHVVKEMWRGLQRLGLKGGRVLEPSMGIGYFFGLVPQELRGRTRLTGVEIERQTGAMAKLLYPDAHVGVHGFEDLKVPNDFYDSAIGNVPFLESGIFDPEYKKEGLHKAPTHDYFIVKTLDKVRPGGVAALITSAGTLDKATPEWRKKMQERGDLIAAIRLPGGAFRKLAKTDVMTDLLVFRKRKPGEAPSGTPWLETKTVPDPAGGDPIPVNEYFAQHPEQMLGRLARTGSMYARDGGKTPNVEFTNDEDFQKRLAEAIDRLPEGLMQDRETPDAFKPGAERTATERRPGTLSVQGGKLHRSTADGVEEVSGMAPEMMERAKGMSGVRDVLDALFKAQLDVTDTAGPRKALNKSYDAFVKKHGLINTKENRKAFAGDPSLPRLEALENKDGVKTDIFRRDTIRSQKAVTSTDKPGDAVALSLRETGGIDIDRIAKLLKKPKEAVGATLVKEGLAYNDPSQGWTPAEEYLSGDVKKKLAEARASAASDPAFKPNVEALEKVQPADIPYTDIGVRLGSPWMDKDYLRDFAAHMLDVRKDFIEVSFVDGRYEVALDRTARHVRGSARMLQTWGTKSKSFLDLLEAALRDAVPVVKYKDEDGNVHVDTEQTAAAQEKLRAIKEEFQDWVWKDRDRREALAKAYNEKVNTVVDPKFTADHYKEGGGYVFPGMSASWSLFPHQANAVWRGVRMGRALYAHEVGAGKTATMIATAMELRRLGLARKPAMVVPKTLLQRATKDVQALYPGAKILSTYGHFAEKDRKRTVSRIATGDWDLVIMSHQHMDYMPMSPEVVKGFIEQEKAELEFVLDEAKKGKRDERTVKELVKKLKKLNERLNALVQGSKKDDAISWEETGIDALFIDEAHVYKKLPIHTAKEAIKGVPTGASQRGTNLLMRTRWMLDRNNGRGVYFATGTPISNSLAEMYNMMRYLQPQELKAHGIASFDAWSNTFGEAVTKAEYKVTGDIGQVTRFAAFVNVPELRHIASMVWDVQRIDDLKHPDGSPVVPRPKKIAEIDSVKQSPEQAALMESLIQRAKSLKGRGGKGTDNMLSIATDARKGALDMRLLGKSDKARKITALVSSVKGIYSKHPGKTQLIFADLGVNKDKAGFSVYDEVIKRLVAEGIPREEIVDFGSLTDKKKEQAILDLQTGKVRVGIGSSFRLGTGVNVQDHLIALHDLDAPWRPDWLEQRLGRAWRQGNLNPWILVRRYVTEGTFDAFMWQTLTWKDTAIKAFISDKFGGRRLEEPDLEDMSYAKMVAAASGVPEVMEKFSLEQEIKQLERAERARKHEIADAKADIPNKKKELEGAKERVKLVQGDIAAVKPEEPPVIFGKRYEKLEDAAKALAEGAGPSSSRWSAVPWSRYGSGKELEAGTFRGLPLTVTRGFRNGSDEFKYYVGRLRGWADDFGFKTDAPSLGGASYHVAMLPKELPKAEAAVTAIEKDLRDLEANASGAFKRGDELAAKRERLAKVAQIITEKGLGKEVLTEEDEDVIAAAPPKDILPDEGDDDDDGPDDGGGSAALASSDMGAGMAASRAPTYRKPEVEDHQRAARAAADKNASRPLDPKEEVLTREQLSKALLRLHETLGAIPGSREFHDRPGRGTLADFLIRSETIRVRTPGDFETTVHEVAHHLQKYLWPASVGRKGLTSKVALFGPHRAELYAMATDPKGGKSPIPEGFAEFVRLYVTDEETARAEAPGFFKAFEREMESMAPSVLAQLQSLRSLYATWKDHGGLYRAIAATWRPSWMDAIPTWGDTKLWAQRVYWGIFDDKGPAKMVMDAWREQKGRDIGASQDAYIVNRVLVSKVGIGHAFLTQGIVDFHNPGAPPTGKGLWQIYDDGDIINHQQEWDGYSLLRRTQELLARKDDAGRKTAKNLLAMMGLSESAVDREVTSAEREFPKFNKAFEEDQEWNRGLLRYLRDAEVLSPEAYDLITDLNQAHVHLQRFMGDSESDLVQGVRKTGSTSQGVHRLGGRSQRSIVSPMLARFRSAWMIPSAAERAYAGRVLADRISELNGGSVFGHRVGYKTKVGRVAVADIAKQLEDVGVKVNDDALDEVLTFFTQAPIANERDQEVYVWRNGKKDIWRFNSDIFTMMAGSDRRTGQPNYLAKAMLAVMKGFTALKRAEIILSPEFGVKNMTRDQVTTAANEGAAPFVVFFKGLEPTIRRMLGDKASLGAEWERAGGTMGGATDLAWPELQKEFQKFLKRGPNELKFSLGHPWRLLRMMSSLSEEPTRVGVYRMLRDNPLPQDVTAKDQQTRAAFRSREGGTDFARAGAWLRPYAGQVAFMTASLEGTDRFFRALKEHPIRAAAWGLSLMMLSAALRALIEEDPEKKKIYSELGPIRRALTYTIIIPTGTEPIRADNPRSFVILSPPKPFEWGFVFNTMFEYSVLDKIYNGEVSKKEALKAAAVSMAPNVIPDLPMFMIENAFDWNMFGERPATPRSVQGLPIHEQYTNRTSELAKAMSRLLADDPVAVEGPFTPTKIDRGLRMGPLADYPLEAIDAAMRAAGIAKDRSTPPDRGIADMPFLRKFTTSFPGETKSVDRFYEFREQAAGAMRAASQKAERKDYQGFRDLVLENDILRYVPVEWIRASSKLQKDFSDWNVQARAIRDSELSGNEKAIRIEEINVKIWLKARAFMEAIDHYRKAGAEGYHLQLEDINLRDRSDAFDPKDVEKSGKVKMKPRDRKDPFAMR